MTTVMMIVILMTSMMMTKVMTMMMTMVTNCSDQEDTDLSSGLGWPDPTLTGENK